MSKTILVTGAAGFIGSHTAQTLLARGDRVVGLDNLNDYYDPARKRANVDEVRSSAPDGQRYTFVHGDIRDGALVDELFRKHSFDAVIHLAAMAGVRASMEAPELYLDVNVNGTLVLLNAVKRAKTPSFVLASTSSVYGNSSRLPFLESEPCDRPLAPYAASKRAAELLCYTYHHLYKLNTTVLRFFTVYGPRGRPDMMAYKVLNSIFFGHQIPLFNSGNMHRDWTYVEDTVAGVIAAADKPLGYEIINLGRGEPVLLGDFVHYIEELAGKKANIVPTQMPETDVLATNADISKARQLLGYQPKVSVREGVERFWGWYQRAVLRRS